MHDTRPGDALVAASHGLREGQAFFTGERAAAGDGEFRNDALDAALASALAAYPTLVAVAAARID